MTMTTTEPTISVVGDRILAHVRADHRFLERLIGRLVRQSPEIVAAVLDDIEAGMERGR